MSGQKILKQNLTYAQGQRQNHRKRRTWVRIGQR